MASASSISSTKRSLDGLHRPPPVQPPAAPLAHLTLATADRPALPAGRNRLGSGRRPARPERHSRQCAARPDHHGHRGQPLRRIHLHPGLGRRHHRHPDGWQPYKNPRLRGTRRVPGDPLGAQRDAHPGGRDHRRPGSSPHAHRHPVHRHPRHGGDGDRRQPQPGTDLHPGLGGRRHRYPDRVGQRHENPHLRPSRGVPGDPLGDRRDTCPADGDRHRSATHADTHAHHGQHRSGGDGDCRQSEPCDELHPGLGGRRHRHPDRIGQRHENPHLRPTWGVPGDPLGDRRDAHHPNGDRHGPHAHADGPGHGVPRPASDGDRRQPQPGTALHPELGRRYDRNHHRFDHRAEDPHVQQARNLHRDPRLAGNHSRDHHGHGRRSRTHRYGDRKRFDRFPEPGQPADGLRLHRELG